MTTKHFELRSETSYMSLALRTASWDDQNNLRDWKNSQRNFFFHTDIISSEQQSEWFNGYLCRPNDFMFIVLVQDVEIGCMGIRLLESEWDVYNVIIGKSEYSKKGYMSQSLDLMLRFAYERQFCHVRLKVLKINPAVTWYQNNGFVILSEGDDHYVMQHSHAMLADTVSIPITLIQN